VVEIAARDGDERWAGSRSVAKIAQRHQALLIQATHQALALTRLLQQAVTYRHNMSR